jgi:CRISPR system Cascade subunit CasC
MKLELHILQNFAPSNLNRDDTGSPKDCELGGVRRARISSQCYKRAIREAFVTHQLLDAEEGAMRTKRLVEAVAEKVAASGKADLERAKTAVVRALGGAKLTAELKPEGDHQVWKTQYLLFLPSRIVGELAELVAAHVEALTPAPAAAEKPKSDEGSKGKPKTKKQEKTEAKDEVPAELRKQIDKLLSDGSRTPELGLFGRMIADTPGWNVDAACQVAHALSTHRVSMEFDFYTAIDDLKRDDTTGSDMMGTIPFNSACFYRYLVVDVADLEKNLGGDAAALVQAKKTLAALIRAAVLAIPSGKQNSMAAHNMPSFILADVRDGGSPRSLANAFVDPVRPERREHGDHGDLVAQSVVRLGGFLSALDGVYGTEGRKELSFCVVDPDETLAQAFSRKVTKASRRASIDALVEAATAAAFGGTA